MQFDRPIFGDKPPKGPFPKASRLPKPRRRMSLNVKLLLFAVIVFVGLGASLWTALRPKEDRYVLDTFQYATVGERDFRNVIHTSGRFVPTDIVAIAAPADAVVTEAFQGAGDDVHTNSLLATLASDALEADLLTAERDYDIALIETGQARLQHAQEVANARGEVEKARNALRDAQAKVPVMESLYALGGISLQELEAARASAENAAADLARREEALTLAEQKAELAVKKAEQHESTVLAKLAELRERQQALTVVAPKGGRILESHVEPGKSLRQGDVLFRLADVASQYIDSVVSPEQAARLHVGSPALIRTSNAQYPAYVAQVSPLAVAADAGAQVPVKIGVAPEIASLFLPNAPVTVEIELGELKGRPYLRRGPYFSSGNASFVYVLNAERTQAERRDVRYGAIDGDFIEVTAGLEPGDEIVFSSYSAFRSYRIIDLIPEGGRPVE